MKVRILSNRVITILLLLAIQNVLGQSRLPEPNTILAKLDSAISNVKTISYRAEHFVVGTLKRGEFEAILTPSRGEVKIARLENDEPFGARIAVNGELIRTQSNATNSPFLIAYDGVMIRKLDKEKRIVYVNEPDQTGKMLFVSGQDLILWVFTSNKQLEEAVKVDSTKYEGVAVVTGVPCHIVYTRKAVENLETETWWFIGLDDYLPRKVQRRYRGVPGEDRTEVTTLTQLVTNADLSAETFILQAPEGYEITKFKGFGKSSPALSIGETAPDWVLFDSRGIKYSLSDFQGQIVIIDFWATWCVPCIKAMPSLQTLYDRFANKGVVVLGINTWDSGDPEKFMRDKGFSYPLLVNGDEVAKKYKVNGLPTLYVIGQDKTILFAEVGTRSDTFEKVTQVIEDNLAN